MRFADWREYQEVVRGILRGSMRRPKSSVRPVISRPSLTRAHIRPSERFAIGTERRNLKCKYRDTAYAARRPKSPNLPDADTQSAAIRAALCEWSGQAFRGRRAGQFSGEVSELGGQASLAAAC